MLKIKFYNCTIADFDCIFDDDTLKFTSFVSLSFLNCGFLNLSTGIRVGRSISSQFFFFGKCYFEKCGIIFDFANEGFCLKIKDCLFSHNKICFRFGNNSSIGNKPNALKFGKLAPLAEPFKLPRSGSQVLSFGSISRCIFRYNDHVLQASNLGLPLKLFKNKIEYSLDVCIDMETCSNVSILDNLFENNFNLKLFDLNSKQSLKSGGKNKLENTIENLRKILGDKNKILVRSNNSCLRIRKNFFVDNNGLLVQILQKPKDQEFCGNVFKSTRKKGLSKKSQIINSRPSQKTAQKESISSDKESKTAQFYLKSRFNESIGKQINPEQIRKRVPVHKILEPRTKQLRPKQLRETKPRLNKQMSYLTLIEKQTSYVDSR